MSENQIIILTSGIMTVRNVKRKTKAIMFKNLKSGDRVVFSVPLKSVGGSYRGTKAAYITARNLATNEINTSSFNQLSNILNAFDFEV